MIKFFIVFSFMYLLQTRKVGLCVLIKRSFIHSYNKIYLKCKPTLQIAVQLAFLVGDCVNDVTFRPFTNHGNLTHLN